MIEDTICDALDSAIGWAIFASAIFILTLQTGYVSAGQDVTQKYMESSAELAPSRNWEHSESTVTYAELCARLMQDIPCDIKIDGQLIEKQWFNCNTFDYSIIPAGHAFRVSHEYNSDGSVKQIIYTHVQGG